MKVFSNHDLFSSSINLTCRYLLLKLVTHSCSHTSKTCKPGHNNSKSCAFSFAGVAWLMIYLRETCEMASILEICQVSSDRRVSCCRDC